MEPLDREGSFHGGVIPVNKFIHLVNTVMQLFMGVDRPGFCSIQTRWSKIRLTWYCTHTKLHPLS